MKKGFNSAIFPDLTFKEVMEFAVAENLDCVEIMCWPVSKAERRYAGVTHIDVTDLDENTVEEINNIIKNTGVEISALGYYPNTMDPDPEKSQFYINHIKKCIVAAEKLGVYKINTFIGKNKTASVEKNLETFSKVWPDIVSFAASHNVEIGIENCPMYYTNDEFPGGLNLASTPAIWRKMFEIIPDANFGLNYDPSHMIWQQIDYIKPLYEFKERIFHVHFKDVKIHKEILADQGIYAPPLNFHTPKLPGLGDIDFSSFISTLYDIGYKDAAVVEVEDRAFEDSLESRKNAIRLSQKYLAQFMV
jgi:Sugar phosphate isomerases/epimerases